MNTTELENMIRTILADNLKGTATPETFSTLSSLVWKMLSLPATMPIKNTWQNLGT
jgi:hypothetical protein